MHTKISDTSVEYKMIITVSVSLIGRHTYRSLLLQSCYFCSMELSFYKYQGAGNDFILADNREGQIRLNPKQIAWLCHRRFGIGADGLMLLQLTPDADFEMVYYNSDGNESTMCGNGGRCIAAFARQLGVAGNVMRFKAIDGIHEARIRADETVALQMQDVTKIEDHGDHVILDTGSPHYIQWVADVNAVNVFGEGRAIRNREAFQPKGINVNFVQRSGEDLLIRTYERGVEDETLACGTGVTAAAIAAVGKETGRFHVPVLAVGGFLSVSFEKKDAATAENIVLTGEAVFVFKGSIGVPSF
ncbi:diaminopimelate epimerase [Taibaiella koreensis]|uniref:diaminopimelate epimerase n=1 Tax=Taibaiella koreensis TaxID=1268548 RepID=UPI001F0897AA|nr:diaminopimelate epimerase [Taibaiella koreensis]